MTSLKGIGLRDKYYPASMAEAGLICKKAEDLAPLLKVLVGDKVSKLKLDEPVNLENLKIFYQIESGDLRASKVSHAMRIALRRAVVHFERITDSVTKVFILFYFILFLFCFSIIKLFSERTIRLFLLKVIRA